MGKRLSNLLSILLVIVLTVQMLPMQVFAQGNEAAETAEAETAATSDAFPLPEAEITVESEITELREADVKHYRMSDGSFAAVQYDSAVHYLTQNGTWAEIDNSLTHEIVGGKEIYSAQNGRLSKSFAADAESGELFSVSVDGYFVSMSLQETADAEIPEQPGEVETMSLEPESGIEAVIENPTNESELGLKLSELGTPSKNHSELLYEDVFDGADIVYENNGYDIKESIVVRSAQAKYDYAFVLKTVGLTASMDGEAVTLKNAEGTEVFRIPAPYMVDADGAVSTAASYTLTAVNDGWVLTLTADKAWLNSSERSFPVVIDPTLTVEAYMNNENNKLYSTYVVEGTPNTAYTNQSGLNVGVGSRPQYGECKIYLGVDTLPTLPANSVMTDAQIRIKHTGLSYAGGGRSDVTVGVYAVSTQYTGTDFGEWLTHLTWNQSEALTVASELLDYVSCTGSTLEKYLSFDITGTVAKWYANVSGTKMLQLRQIDLADNETVFAELQGWSTGSSGPVLIISYRNTVGLEGYYTYQTLSAGNAGTVYIGDYTNRLTLVNTIASYESGAVSASVGLVYNTAYAGKDTDGTGVGWKLSLSQTISNKTVDGSEYLVYKDADGTEHYFPKTATNTYKDEDGLGLTIVKSSSGYTMTDRDKNNTLTFSSGGKLTKITDSNGNVVNVNYTNGKITSVTAKPDGGSTVTVATLNYTDGKLTKVTDCRGNETVLGYGGENLVQIEYPDSTKAKYGYEGGYLTGTEDTESKYYLSFTYRTNAYGGKTVNAVREYAGENRTEGGGFHVYKPTEQLAGYRFYGTDHIRDTADDVVVYYVFDHSGRTICAYELNYDKTKVLSSTSASYTENSGTSGSNNRITASGSIGQSQNTLYIDGGFENGVTLSGIGYGKQSVSSATDNRVHGGYKSVKLSSDGSDAYVTTTANLTAGEEYTFSVWLLNYNTENWDEDSSFEPILTDANGNISAIGTARQEKTSRSIDRGWERFSWSFTATSSGSYGIGIRAKDYTGSIYIDDMQLEKGNTVSATNLIQNGKPTSKACWNGSYVAYDTSEASPLGTGVLRIDGTPKVNKNTTQTVKVNDAQGNCYVLSGWGKATAIGRTTDDYSGDGSYFGMIAAVVYTDSDAEELHFISFDKDYDDWQYASGVVIPKRTATVKLIRVYLVYKNNGNTAYFDGIRLESAACSSYTYDDKGNAIAATEGGANTSCEYKSGTSLLTKYTSATGVVSSFTYESGTNNLLSATSCGVTTANTYNAMGLVTQSKSTAANGWYLQSNTTYNGYGKATTYTNTNGVTTAYTYGTSGTNKYMLASTQTGELEAQRYRYNDASERLSLTYINGYSIQYYLYADGRVSDISRKGKVNGEDFWQSYSFEYDEFGNMTKLSVSGADNASESAGQTLATYSYVNHDLLQSITYGNGQSISYAYDAYGRQISETYNDSSYTYAYGAEGELISQSGEGETFAYEYDTLGRLIRSKEYNGSELVQGTEHIYDGANRLQRQAWRSDGGEFTQTYSYDASKGYLNTLELYLPGNTYSATSTNTPSLSMAYAYDALNRLSQVTTTKNGTELFYSAYYYGAVSDEDYNRRSNLPKHFNYRDADGELINGYTYAYDATGNISSETNAATNAVQQYTYDGQNQLTQVKDANGNTLYSYTYDTVGNIRSKSDGGVTHNYTYGNAQWADQLTAFDGHAITYDGAGNPLTYYNGADYTLTWSRGRQLATAETNGVTATYTYDMSGVRNSKTVDGVTYEFTTLSGKLMRQTWSGNELQFVYDASGRPYMLLYTPANGATQTYYYYVLNVQGDVVGLMNASGDLVVRYSYDPWGKPISVTDGSGTEKTSATFIGNINPLRYRGYYYDTETGFYYLQSRYYDPNISRFLNADSYVTTDITGLLSGNMYAYCENNPVMCSDPTGEVGTRDAAIGAAFGAISSLVDYWLETQLEGTEFNWGTAIFKMAVGAAVGGLEGAFNTKIGNALKVLDYLSSCLETLTSDASLEEMLIAIGYDGVYLLASMALEKAFKGNDQLSDTIAMAIADLIIFGEFSTLEGISKSLVADAYKESQFVVASAGSARTIATMKQ